MWTTTGLQPSCILSRIVAFDLCALYTRRKTSYFLLELVLAINLLNFLLTVVHIIKLTNENDWPTFLFILFDVNANGIYTSRE